MSFGLIWLDYLRRRERRVTIERLVVLLPAGRSRDLHRIPYLDPARACCEVFAYSEEDYSARLDPGDRGNLETKLDVFKGGRARRRRLGWTA